MRRREWAWLLADLVVCGLCALVPSYGVVAAYSVWTGIPWGDLTLRGLGIWAVIAVLLIQNTAICCFVWYRSRYDTTAPLANPDQGSQVLFAVIGVPLVLGVNVVVGGLFAALGATHNQAAAFPLVRGDTVGNGVFALVAVVLVPLAEEYLFRGFVYARIRSLAGPRLAVFLSAAVFAGAHAGAAAHGVWVLVAQTFVLGLVLGWLRLRSDRLFPSMVAHIANNAVAILLVLSCLYNPEPGCPST